MALYQGLTDFSAWAIVLITVVMCHLTLLGVTLFLHRSMAHRVLYLHPVLQHFFRVWLWMTTGMNTREWVAVHRKHHAVCETPEDPHSPIQKGILKVLFFGALLYRKEAQLQGTLDRYGQGCPDDWMERHVYGPWPSLGVVLMLVIDLLLFGVVAGLLVWVAQMLLIPLLAAGVINGLGHFWGYRNFETPDASRNILPLGLIIAGEELHNNHHAYANSAKLSVRPWEFDIGWAYIRLFQWLRLARPRQVAPIPRHDPEKRTIDLETVRALVVSRMHVMEDYARKVIAPVHRLELRSRLGLRRQLRGVPRMLHGEANLTEDRRVRLDQALASSEALCIVRDFRKRLMDIWSQTGSGPDRLLKALQDWCQLAERSGVEALRLFAAHLRGYGLRPRSEAA